MSDHPLESPGWQPPTEDQFGELLSVEREIACGALSVVVDFNDLLADRGDEAWEIIAKLKDLLT